MPRETCLIQRKATSEATISSEQRRMERNSAGSRQSADHAKVESMSFGEIHPSTDDTAEGGVRGTWGLLRHKRKREADTNADCPAEELPNGHRPQLVDEQRIHVLEARRADTLREARSDLSDKLPTLSDGWQCHIPILMEESRISGPCDDDLESTRGNE